MTEKGASVEELVVKSQAKGYESGAHQTKNSIKKSTEYVSKTLKDQGFALRQYEK